jgi:hypothetical protein
MNSEGDLQKHLVSRMRIYGHVSEVECPDTCPGIPDLNFYGAAFSNKEVWLELKWCYPGQRAPKMRPKQVQWIRHRVGEGGNVWVLIGVAQKHQEPRLLLVRGALVEELALAHAPWQDWQEKACVQWRHDSLNVLDLLGVICA